MTSRAYRNVVKLNDIVDVKDFGATGDGVTDDTAAIQAAANAVRTTSKTLFIPAGNFRVTQPLDFLRVRNVRSEGTIVSTITSGAGVTLGTTSNANSDLLWGHIQLNIRNAANNNAALSGTIGILIRGVSRCTFKLSSICWDTAIEIAPQDGVGTQYVAFTVFEYIFTQIARKGLVLRTQNVGSGNGWINENTFVKCDLYPQFNALPGETIGLHFTGDFAQNKNVFLDTNTEGQAVSVWFERGIKNAVYNLRNEASGPIRFGANVQETDRLVVENVVQCLYQQPTLENYSPRPNVVYYNNSPQWNLVLNYDYNDFYTVGSSVYSNKWLNTVTGTSFFQFGILDAANRSFNPGSNHSAYIDIPCTQNDVFRIFRAAETGLTLTFTLLDATKTVLPSLSAGQKPYLGTNVTANISGVSGVNSFWDWNNVLFDNPFFLQINRSEVKFLRVMLRAAITTTALTIEKLINPWTKIDSFSFTPLADIKPVSSIATAPDYPGQLAFLSTSRVLMGRSQTEWLQLSGQVTLSASATDIAAVGNTINTANKAAGVLVRDTTNNRLMMARGPLAADPWDVVDGSASVTPS
jgi:hypothetical protein